jgi:SRSO17 transposase
MSDLEGELSSFMRPFLDRLGHKRRQQMCPLYVAGLIGPGDRKSIEPTAARSLQDNTTVSIISFPMAFWDAGPIEEELARQADCLVGGADAFLVIDDMALPKKGDHSVGVAPQYASMLGKRANCQRLVSLTLACDEVPVPVGLLCFFPKAGSMIQAGWQRLVFPSHCGCPEPSRRLHSTRSTG